MSVYCYWIIEDNEGYGIDLRVGLVFLQLPDVAKE